MCGIAGFIDTSLSSDSAIHMLEKMLHSIEHRGPDARGRWLQGPLAFGHNRLSIIDLSEDGNQPMHFFDSVITYNGEIYNYLEVRESLVKKGYSFKTQSDTEVILAAYREYGTKCVDYFVGMWAFALWDKKKEILFCSRDRFGIKPFYYIQEGDKFYFGSEYKVLKQTPLFSNDLNYNQISRGLQLGLICYEEETYFSKLKALPEACNLIYSSGKITLEKYWELKTGIEYSGSFEEKKNKFYELLSESVKLHLRSDVEVAVGLSGGLDSSALTAMMANLYPEKKYHSFSIYYEGKNEVDERPFIRSVIEKYPQVIPDYFQPDQKTIPEYLHKIIDKTEIPATGSSNFSHYFLVKQIHNKSIKVVLDGQGADEYLGGYMHSFYRLFADKIRQGNLIGMTQELLDLKKNQNWTNAKTLNCLGLSLLSTFKDEAQLNSLEYSNYFPFLSMLNKNKLPLRIDKVSGNKLDNFLYQLIKIKSLPTILHYVDRMTMSHSLESRVPFLDHRLVEFGFQLNNEDRINQSRTKYILRESMKNLLPEKVYNRKDKKGFVTPGEVNWLRGPLKHLLDVDFKKLDFLNTSEMKNVIESYKSGNDKNAKLVWRIATLNYWIKNFV